MPMTIFISPHLKGSGIRIQTSPLIIKFDLFKTQINNFVIHKYLEETDQTAKSCKRNVRIKTYLFSIDTVFRGYFPIRTFITFPFDLSFPFIYFLRLLGTSVESDALSVESSIFRGGKYHTYTYFLWITFWSKPIFASISIRHRNTFYFFIHLFSAIESPKEIKVSIKYQ